MVNQKVYVSKPIPRLVSVAILIVFFVLVYLQFTFTENRVAGIILVVFFFIFSFSMFFAIINKRPLFLIVVPVSMLVPIFSPIFMCVYAISLLPEGSFFYIKFIPWFVLFYSVFITIIEFLLIDWKNFEKRVFSKMFERKNGFLAFKEGVQVLFLSPFRNDASWLFSGRLRSIQKLIIVLGFFFCFYLYIKSSSPNKSDDVFETVVLLFSFLGFITQPMLLDIMIKIRLVLMKQRGDI